MIISFWTIANLIPYSDFDTSMNNVIEESLVDYIFKFRGNYDITYFVFIEVEKLNV